MSNKTSDEKIVTKEDLEVLEERIFHYEITKKIGNIDKMIPQAVKENEAIKHLLVEREQKDKRIKELEEENEKYIVKLTDEQYRKLEDSIREEAKQEFEQKVKDKIEELKQEYDEILSEYGNLDTDVIINVTNKNVRKHLDELVIKILVLQELLEGEK